MTENQKKMLLDWMRKIHQMEYAHRFESMSWNKWNYWLGVPAIIIAAVVGAVSGMCEINEVYKNMAISFAGIVIAILAGLQTFLKPQEYTEKHKAVSSSYEKLRHKLEFLLQFETDPNQIKVEAEKIRDEWNGYETLNVTDYNFKLAKDRIKSLNKYAEELSFLETRNN